MYLPAYFWGGGGGLRNSDIVARRHEDTKTRDVEKLTIDYRCSLTLNAGSTVGAVALHMYER